jgi:hypothetical protein
MAITMSPDEVRQHYETAMGPELGAAFHRLWNDLTNLHVRWEEYRTVFGTNEQRIELMNRAGGGFFGLVQDVLWKDVILAVCRFTDPATAKGRETLSLRYLPLLIIDYDARLVVIKMIDVAEANATFARDWRNRLVAHRDRQLALEKPGAKPLDGASRKGVQEAIDAITAVIAHVEGLYGLPETDFDHIPDLGGESMLRVLRDGLDARAAALDRLKSGQSDAARFFTRPLP